MQCKKCKTLLDENAKYCVECGKRVEVEKVENLTKSNEISNEKIKSHLKNTGNSIYAIGYFTILYNIGVYFWSIFYEGIDQLSLTGVILIVSVSIVFIILGNRIRNHIDNKIKSYLKILIGLSALLLIWVFVTGGHAGLLFIVMTGYLVHSLVKINKAMKQEKFTNTLKSPHYRINQKHWIIFVIISIVLIFIGMHFDNVAYNRFINTNQAFQNVSETYSANDLIDDVVNQTKQELDLPFQFNNSVTLMNVSAEENAIRYHYLLSNIDTSTLTNDDLKSNVIGNVCQDNDIISLLNQGVQVEYSYVVNNSNRVYFLSFSHNDCFSDQKGSSQNSYSQTTDNSSEGCNTRDLYNRLTPEQRRRIGLDVTGANTDDDCFSLRVTGVGRFLSRLGDTIRRDAQREDEFEPFTEFGKFSHTVYQYTLRPFIKTLTIHNDIGPESIKNKNTQTPREANTNILLSLIITVLALALFSVFKKKDHKQDGL